MRLILDGKFCGTEFVDGVTCGDGKFCDRGEECQEDLGECRPLKSIGCTSTPDKDDSEPTACGCDGKLYHDACDAAIHGINLDESGLFCSED